MPRTKPIRKPGQYGCGDMHKGWTCSMPRGHEGNHEAWGLERFCYEWPNKWSPVRMDDTRAYLSAITEKEDA